MKEIYLIRHGSTNLNEKGVYQGWSNEPLNEKGRKRAKILAAKIKASTNGLNNLYSSDLKRAEETADIFTDVFEISIKWDSNLRELDYGKWEGRSYQELLKNDPHNIPWDEPEKFDPPDGETIEELRERVLRSWNRIINQRGKTAVISHSGPIKLIIIDCIRASLAGFWRLSVDPGSVSKIIFYDKSPVLSRLNYIPNRGL